MEIPHWGIFEEETFAVQRLASISWVLPLAIVVSSMLDLLIVDLFMVIAFQKWLHPWRRIIAKSNVGESSEKQKLSATYGDTQRKQHMDERLYQYTPLPKTGFTSQP